MKGLETDYRSFRPDKSTRSNTTGFGHRWNPRSEWYMYDPEQIRREVKQLSRPNEELLRMAEKNPPPQHWFDEDDDPTQPED